VLTFVVVAPLIVCYVMLCYVMVWYVMLCIHDEHYPVYVISIACYVTILKII
jgi:hypothetical protein